MELLRDADHAPSRAFMQVVMRRRKAFQWSVIVAALAAAAAFAYIRPLSVAFAARGAYLYAIRMRGAEVRVRVIVFTF
jgi:hypothetical protein